MVVGDAAEDCAYSFTHDRSSTRTLWVPVTGFWTWSIGPTVRRTLAQCIRALAKGAGQTRPVIVTTLSVDEANRQAVADALSAEAWMHNVQIGSSSIDAVEAPRDLLLLDAVRFNDHLRPTFVDGRLATLLELEWPTSAESRDPGSAVARSTSLFLIINFLHALSWAR